MMRLANLLSLSPALALLVMASWAGAEDIVKTNGEELGVTIMGQIVQKDIADSVALVKEEGGTVKAVKAGHVINGKYKVLAVTGRFIEVIDKSGKRIQIYQNKFAGEARDTKTAAASGGPTLRAAGNDYFQEEGFERRKGKITMTGAYRDKVVQQDLAKVLMQATAEPYMEGGQIMGFKMSQIDPGSIYDKAGMVDGDIVTAINGQELSSVAGSIALLKSLKGSDHLDITIRRGTSKVDFSIDVQ